MEFRNECKYKISNFDAAIIEPRLSMIVGSNPFGQELNYSVHGLYFNDVFYTSFNDKYEETLIREKYRICYYNHNTEHLKLEKKIQINGMSQKEECDVSKEFVEMIIHNRFDQIVRDPLGRTGEDVDPLIQEFYWKSVGCGLRPRMRLDYDRNVYFYPQGNVRVSLDRDIRKGDNIKEFLNPEYTGKPVSDRRIVLGAKWDKYIPDAIRNAVTLTGKTFLNYIKSDSRNKIFSF